MSKVFCVGFHKTGTKSLAEALRILGYRVTGPNWTIEPDVATTALSRALAIVDHFDAFQDNPWPILFRELDDRYPGSKFILTLRDTDEWLASVSRYFAGGTSPMREWIYGFGNPEGHEDAYAHRYTKHNADVVAHFSGRPADLFVMNLTHGDNWPGLCEFLGRDIPSCDFPATNRGGARYPSGTTTNGGQRT